MKALGNILGLLALGLLLLAVGLGFYLTQLLDPNDYKEQIRQLAREQMGLELNIDGDIGWSLFPWLGLRLHDTSLASARTPERPFASLRRLDLAVQLMPLLRHQEVWMRRIDLDGLELSLSRDDRGLANWEGIGEPLAVPPAPAGEDPLLKTKAILGQEEEEVLSAPPEAQTLAGLSPRPRLMIESLRVTDAQISYQDLRTGQQFSAAHLTLSTGNIREGQAIPLQLNTLLRLSPQLQMHADIQGNLHFDLSARRYQWEGLRLTGELSGPALKGLTADVGIQGELALDLASGLLEGRGIKLSLNQWRALAEWRVQPLQAEPQLSGTLSLARIDPMALLESLGQPLPNLPTRSALRSLELATRLSLNSERLSLEDLDLGLDGSHLQGAVVLGLGDRPHWDVRLKGDRVVLDRYWALTQHETRPSEPVRLATDSPLPEMPSQLIWSSELLPLAGLRRFDARLQFDVAQLVLAQAPLEAVSLKAQLQSGQLKLNSLSASLQGAPLLLSAGLDLHAEPPALSAQADFKAVPVEQLLLSQQPDIPVQGLLNLTANVQTHGGSPQAWAAALSGTLDFNLDKGLLRQSLLEPWLCRGSVSANAKLATAGVLSGWDLPIRSVQGSMQVKNGIAHNLDLRLASPGLSIRGQGTLDTRMMGMDYRLTLSPLLERRDLPDPACAQSRRLVSLHCRGPVLLGSRSCRLAESLN